MHGRSEDKCELSVTTVPSSMNSKLIGAEVLIPGEYISASVGSMTDKVYRQVPHLRLLR
jgi:hypothetical protein